MSPEEQRTALGASDEDETAARYALLREGAAAMAEDGLPVFDLTQVFSDTDEAVYVDSCCHVNELGNRLMVAAIVSAIADWSARQE
jgi:hypothetical protein